ncbi:MAG: Uma2 family endonuclease [Cyanobacteriota bacterium]|nr:Uma2 family endonuclease [Cyanobacteriota bacterium]
MQVQTKPVTTTPEEYLALEEVAEEKNEYIDGEIVPMTGATSNHNQISVNLCAHLYFALRQQNYRVFAGDLRVWIPEYNTYTYPDVMVVEGELAYHNNRKDTINNPAIICEVLSRSTANRDRTEKFKIYRSIPEFKEYILIDQYKTLVEHYVKQESNKWVINYHEVEEAKLVLETVDFEITLKDIYDRVNFENSEGE